MKNNCFKVRPAFRYRPRFALIVEAADEADQKRLHTLLAGLKLKPRLVRV